MGKKLAYILLCLVAALFLYFLLSNRLPLRPKQNPKGEMYTIEGLAQGSYYRVSYFNDLPQSKQKQVLPELLQVELDSILHAFDLCVSLWEDSSLLCQVNRGEDPELSPMFIDLFKKSMEISSLTEGAFDITVAPLVKAYGFGKEKGRGTVLSPSQTNNLLQKVGYTKIRLQNGQLIRTVPGIQLDFNAIAQGYCADMVASWLNHLQIHRYLVDIGGEMVVKGSKNTGEPWTIGIEKPADSANSERIIYTSLRLQNEAIVTSGNYRKYVEIDGKRYSHAINPITGQPSMDSLLSATVICPESWKADAIATAFMVMGLEKTKAFLSQHTEYKVFLIYATTGKGYGTWQTENLLH